ncbi:hypothetical protein QTP81_13025 [Alteromonas sp. ASW11-36]|uniref:Uncharacterized protein n=1 Tax=Alteromonas arenosi TaxID=3055817 RepID=A0ABT7SZ95_9ALTE|nr:hypothetical protein [Alteromonas sp. ASW11-36]MDM7861518.1 hypothetical protein [Alteromonas sp. ASW11-36]
MNKATVNNHDQRLKKGSRVLFFWTLLWMLSVAGLVFGPKLMWDFDHTATVITIVINLVLGIKMLLVNKQHLNDMDDMQQKIHYNAMAISLGCTMVLGIIYGSLKPAGLLEENPNPSNLLFVMGLSYLIAVFINFRKYL